MTQNSPDEFHYRWYHQLGIWFVSWTFVIGLLNRDGWMLAGSVLAAAAGWGAISMRYKWATRSYRRPMGAK